MKKNQRDPEKAKLAKQVLKTLDELAQKEELENIVKDNCIKFKINNDEYRLRKPNADEGEQIGTLRRKKYMELVKDDSYLFTKQWIEIYKKKGVNIEKMEQDIKNLEAKIKELLIRLAQLTSNEDIEKIKNEVIKLKEQMYDLSIERTDYLGYSIEEQINIYATAYTCYLILEKKTDDKWVRAFANYDAFKDNNTILTTRALYYVNYLIYS